MNIRSQKDLLLILNTGEHVKCEGLKKVSYHGKVYKILQDQKHRLFFSPFDGTIISLIGAVKRFQNEYLTLMFATRSEYLDLLTIINDLFIGRKTKEVVSFHIHNRYCYTLSVWGSKFYYILHHQTMQTVHFATLLEMNNYLDTLPTNQL